MFQQSRWLHLKGPLRSAPKKSTSSLLKKKKNFSSVFFFFYSRKTISGYSSSNVVSWLLTCRTRHSSSSSGRTISRLTHSLFVRVSGRCWGRLDLQERAGIAVFCVTKRVSKNFDHSGAPVLVFSLSRDRVRRALRTVELLLEAKVGSPIPVVLGVVVGNLS